MIVMNAEQKINDVVKNAVEIELFDNGKQTKFFKAAGAQFDEVLDRILACFEGSFITPALGVSLHKETVAALNSGRWAKIIFDGEQQVGDLPFDALLFRLDECYGVNLIRQHNGKFAGRCIYLNFENLVDLSKILL